MKKERATTSDEQRERMLIAEQIERAAAEKGPESESPPPVETGLKRDETTEKVVLSFAPKLSYKSTLLVHFLHALGWRLVYTFGLGFVLSEQSRNKFLVRHYLKHYHYPHNDRGQGAVHEAFQNWKQIYNTSMCMTYGGYS